ncbi:unnamed protein product, partial [Callosobruchus maculatus]
MTKKWSLEMQITHTLRKCTNRTKQPYSRSLRIRHFMNKLSISYSYSTAIVCNSPFERMELYPKIDPASVYLYEPRSRNLNKCLCGLQQDFVR